MIDDSWPWKRDLWKTADALMLRKTQRRWSDASWARVEKDLFIAAYATRKLIESQKLSDEVEAIPLIANEYAPKVPVRVGHSNRHRIEKLYELNVATPTTVKLSDFCNQLIHSFVFSPTYEPGVGLQGFFVASDRAREHRCFYFTIDSVVEALRRVATDDIVRFESRCNAAGVETIISKSNHPRWTLRSYRGSCSSGSLPFTAPQTAIT